MIAMAGAFVAGIVVVGLVIFAYSGMIDHQLQRNQRLTDEIAVLDKSIEEIKDKLSTIKNVDVFLHNAQRIDPNICETDRPAAAGGTP